MNKYQSGLHELRKSKHIKIEFYEQEPVQNKFCTVCGTNYEDIYQHLQDKEHVYKIKEFKDDYDQIDKLCVEFNTEFLAAVKPVERFVMK